METNSMMTLIGYWRYTVMSTQHECVRVKPYAASISSRRVHEGGLESDKRD